MRPFAPGDALIPCIYSILQGWPVACAQLRTMSDLQVSKMLRIYECIATAHDLRLVGLAAVVCILASYAAINLLRYAAKSQGPMRAVWLGVSAISTGFGILATHFIAILAFSP